MQSTILGFYNIVISIYIVQLINYIVEGGGLSEGMRPKRAGYRGSGVVINLIFSFKFVTIFQSHDF